MEGFEMFKQIFILILFVLSLISTNAMCNEIDNSIILEKLNSLARRIDDKFEAVNRRIDDTNKQIDLLRQDIDRRFQSVDKRFESQQVFNYFILGGVLTILTLISALIIIVIWDRKASLKPIFNEINSLKNDLKDDLKEKVQYLYDHLGLDINGLQKFKTV